MKNFYVAMVLASLLASSGWGEETREQAPEHQGLQAPEHQGLQAPEHRGCASCSITSDGSVTAFYLEAGVVEAGGNFLYIDVTTPDGRTESVKTSCFNLVDDDGEIFPWTNYGDLVPENARAYIVLPRIWPVGTQFRIALLDRDGAELIVINLPIT